ncbi:OsmC family protein [Cytophaga aurantiaca]|uniref:OsmC family protein n=1 Tax=Cytophaga aurantiaca TaxID=29530 RepID=UPI000377CB67|nr:OsmC family protein [Cytophaga aurantiaca]
MKEYFYEVHLSWKEKRSGLLRSPGLAELETFSPETPVSEEKKRWTPEQLLAGSLSSCFMKAFLDSAEAAGLKIVGYRSQCFIKMEQSKDAYHPVAILLQPTITLSDEMSRKTATDCITEAESFFCMSKILRIPLDIHPQVEYMHSKRSVYKNS